MKELKRLVVGLAWILMGALFAALVFADVKDPATIKTDATADLATNTEMFLQPTIDIIDSINIKYADNTAMEAGGANMPNGTTVYLLGHTTTNDGGEGTFVLDTGAADVGAENDGTIFASAGGTDWYWRRTLIDKTLTPQMFGAVADNSTDDATEIQLAADACDVLNSSVIVRPVLYFPPGLYRTLSTITVKEYIHIDMDGEIIYGGGSESAAGLVVGTTDVSNFNVKLRVRVGRSSISDWTDEGSIGIKLFNVGRSDIWPSVCANANISTGGFTIGLQCIGSATGASDRGFSRNMVRLGGIFNCKYSVDLTNESSGAGKGFTSSNWFHGGTISGTGVSGESRYGYRCTTKDGNYKLNSNNVIYGGNIEIKAASASPGEAVAVLIENGQSNVWYDLRNEGNSATVMRVLDDPLIANHSNHCDWTHTTGVIDDQSKQASSTGGFIEDKRINRPSRLVFDSGPMDRNLHFFNGNTTVHIPDVHLMVHGGSGAVSDNMTDGGITAFVSETFTVDTGTEEIIDTAHEMRVNDIVFLTTDSADLPVPLLIDTPYYVISTTANRFIISTSKGGSAVNITDAGTGVHTYESRTRYVTLQVNYGTGVFMDTTQCKQFFVTRDIDDGSANEGRMLIIPYDGQGVRLEDNVAFTVVQATSDVNLNATAHGMSNGEKIYLDSSTNDLPLNLLEDVFYYVVNQTANDFEVSLTSGGSSVTFDDDGGGTLRFERVDLWVKSDPQANWTTAFGGGYRNGSNLTSDARFLVRAEVKRVNVVVVCVTGTVRIRRFQIHVPEAESMPDVFLGYESGVQNRFFATVAPTEGVYTDLGMQIAGNVPVSTETPGWVLTTVGAPGVWTPLASIPLSGSVTYDPASLLDQAGETTSLTVTGAALGDFVQVSAPYDLEDITVTGYVQAADTVEIRLQNESTGTVDLASGTWRVKVTSP